jgi:cyclopropane-fatty-acyl-phospholipid synthase
MDAKADISNLLSTAGVNINGNNPWDIKVYNDSFYEKALAAGSIGVGEAYIEKWWDAQRVDEFFSRILKANPENKIAASWKLITDIFLYKIFNMQSRSRSFRIGDTHYNLGNHLFEHMLDKRLVYSCGYWKNATTLDEAQEAKLDLICQKLNLRSGMHILDIGSGWGSFAKFAAEKYGVSVTGITVSSEQAELATSMCKGLPVEFKLMDYRLLNGAYDHIVSIGMFEHVGYKNYNNYMQVAHRCLKDDGLFLLHTIGGNRSEVTIDPWINKYIFKDAMLPSIQQIGRSIEGVFVMEDWHNFSADYDLTLMAWHDNFVSSWEVIKQDYDEKFYRMWKYYLLMCAGSFRSRKNQLWQIVLSKNGVPGGYESVR